MRCRRAISSPRRLGRGTAGSCCSKGFPGSERPGSRVYELASRALRDTALLGDLTADGPPFWTAAATVLFAERYDEYAHVIDVALEDSAARGSQRGFGFGACFGSPLHYERRAIALAAEEARRGELVGSRRVQAIALHALTPAELRVCRLAAQGKSNRHVARALFVSLRTVETHLTNPYRKLGISSRGELAESVLGQGASERFTAACVEYGQSNGPGRQRMA